MVLGLDIKKIFILCSSRDQNEDQAVIARRRQIQYKGRANESEFFQSEPRCLTGTSSLPEKYESLGLRWSCIRGFLKALRLCLITSQRSNKLNFEKLLLFLPVPNTRWLHLLAGKARITRRHNSTGSRLNFGKGPNFHFSHTPKQWENRRSVWTLQNEGICIKTNPIKLNI